VREARFVPSELVAEVAARAGRVAVSKESEMAFDRTAGGHRFDFSLGVCFLCGISREEFEDDGHPQCTGQLYEKADRLRISPDKKNK
jgi:hypothetical protein